ncbi:hypothetical protein E2C01_018299 [Portunus trituberculatus]|uniref:Uncharacterized protein n=1 Tax=Portunus trituberculatus TaxID=210409 RepID=A0A5B7DW30_PORTR|nr:hypothetical protein [Portunus trituberculatus]
MVPLEILVGICKAWKKLVFSGPRPVFWLGMVTGQGAMAPARAGAFFLLASSLSRTSTRSSLIGVGLQVASDGLAHHGVLAHEHHSTPTQGHTDLLHLLGANIVSAHNEATAVLIKQLSDLSEVGFVVLPVHYMNSTRNISLRLHGSSPTAVSLEMRGAENTAAVLCHAYVSSLLGTWY